MVEGVWLRLNRYLGSYVHTCDGRQVGVDMCLDVHGDEALPYIFLAGNEVRFRVL